MYHTRTSDRTHQGSHPSDTRALILEYRSASVSIEPELSKKFGVSEGDVLVAAAQALEVQWSKLAALDLVPLVPIRHFFS